jgi:beta-glucanase (GH16 family)
MIASALAASVTLFPAQAKSDWHGVFYDDFTSGLNTAWWGTYYGQPGGDTGGWWHPSHVTVSNGVLNLETYQDPTHAVGCTACKNWVSGGVSMAPALKQTYGRFRVRLRMDTGRGVAVVLSLMPVADQWPPEIDFGENGGCYTPGTCNDYLRDSMSATFHYGADNRQIQNTVKADFTQWHVLGLDWTAGRLQYTLDGIPYATVTNSTVPTEPMEMDIQTQAGTCGYVWAPCPDPTTPAHVNLQLDWVRAYSYIRPPKQLRR